MASIAKIIQLSKQLSAKPLNPYFTSSIRNAVHLRDYMPSDYPKNEEERKKAARKYNLHPDEYVPFPKESEMGEYRGDYPNLPLIGHAAKDPYYPWDMPGDRRNYKETLPEEFDMIGPEKIDWIGTKPRISNRKAFVTFFSFVTIFVSVILLAEDYKYFPAVMEKQWPQAGVKHYTFDPAK
ncbi:NADH dehydrogenase [ubiquinone] 1 beta subcomplex subunit 8, mitochondrial [Leptopilina heterotoma]|uniref:NADH dehydrogenase [ubiquinone] 1 beta subcomplex subunit 8, mitochondrial n=1 Tax=Leptopilina heterotoma TaxID=63436 RepID=UPI001CA8B959|nr:NADH dehydrogenase [ubiquinone] 1 beta subcomplex subunit 8, mitochondrial [Leptopilina heterotoma]